MDTTWMEQANCRDVLPETFFPEPGTQGRLAARICSGCLVKGQCLEYALHFRINHGIWGGTSERERKRIAARRRQAQPSVASAIEDAGS
jgi:WhiB family redox-sensing transcriptional regulator